MLTIDRMSSRLAELLRQSENPYQEMRAIARRLLDEGIGDFQPDPAMTPEEFAELIGESPQLRDAMADLRTDAEPSLIKNSDELISLLLPAETV